MYKVIALMGKAGSGKDTMLHKIMEHSPHFHEIVSCTTRPKREGESEGVNYFFLTPEQFNDKVNQNKMLEYTCFNDWYYGTSYDSLKEDTINVGVFNPTGVRRLLRHPDVEVYVYYITAPPKTRLLRQLNREQDPDVNEIIRRYATDEKDFSYLYFNYSIIPNEIYEDLNTGVMEIVSQFESTR